MPRRFWSVSFGVLGFYLLSHGPVVGWYSARNSSLPHTLEVIYAPLNHMEGVIFAHAYLWHILFGGHVE